jgi:hypothetical protein
VPAPNVTTLLTYADLQMAAEAIDLGRFLSGEVTLEAALIVGNGRSSRFTPTQAAQFVLDWEVVRHQENTGTGFSGTLFRCRRTDVARGLVEGELVLSFRSTEFVDDAARDNQATNALEIKELGWAFGQIADMKNWIDSLRAGPNPSIPAGTPVAVTGYSLGGHLAGAYMQSAGRCGSNRKSGQRLHVQRRRRGVGDANPDARGSRGLELTSQEKGPASRGLQIGKPRTAYFLF